MTHTQTQLLGVCGSGWSYLPNMVTSVPTSREPTIPPIAKIPTVSEYSSVTARSSRLQPYRSVIVSL